MQRHSQEEEQKLRLYIVYEDHLYAEQLSKILSLLDALYNYLYIAKVPELYLPLPLETRMRVEECRTGQSIELLLSEGIRQVFDPSGPIIQVMEPIGVVTVMVPLLLKYGKSFAEFLKIWDERRITKHGVDKAEHEANKAKHEADKAKHEADKAKYETERLKREIENEEIEKKLNRSHFDLSTVPIERKQQASEAITEFFNLIGYAPNIVRVRVNEIVILDKRPEIQSSESEKVIN